MSFHHEPDKRILPLIAMAAAESTSVEDLVEAIRATNSKLLRKNAPHVLWAIPGKNDTAIGMIKFASVHHLNGANPTVFAMIAHTCVTGSLVDSQALQVLEHMLDRGWIQEVWPGLIGDTLAFGKTKCAQMLNARAKAGPPI